MSDSGFWGVVWGYNGGMRVVVLTLIAFLIGFALFAGKETVFSQYTGHPNMASGEIVRIHLNHIEIKETPDLGQTYQTFEYTIPRNAVIKNADSPSDLKVGDQIEIEFDHDEDERIATYLRVDRSTK
ncbi:MAG: hypothetical protein KC649_00705 [Candidatus Omnitrophica bacterium]|nr:hypothetical protein [Candidatus Omnitrophota bacterium]